MLLGVDTLTYHCRLAAGEVSHEEIFEEVGALGFDFVQLNARHLIGFSEAQIAELRDRAGALGLALTLAGDVIGRAEGGDVPWEGAARLRTWLDLARRLGSPFARVSSGFYRNELVGDQARVRAELHYVVEALRIATADGAQDVKVILENHSDFSCDEYMEIVSSVGEEAVGVFLDLINPVSLLMDPLPVVERLAPLAVAGHVKDYRICSNYVEDGAHRRGFEVQWCYPGEGVADLPHLFAALLSGARAAPYYLSIEGLDNRAGVADQRARLAASLALLHRLIGAHAELAG